MMIKKFYNFYYLFINIILIECQIINRPPQFIPGSGDMSRFSLSENTTVGSSVYRLQGTDPEDGALRYSISGPVFSVNRDSGVVTLSEPLDREKQDLIEVIISLTDEGIFGTEPNTISLRREIPIRDYNDNSPVFIGRPYTTSISESTLVGSEITIHPKIIVTDRDDGQNSEISLSCFRNANRDADICDTFRVQGQQISNGNYTANIQLLKQLDFETRSTYILTIVAKDNAPLNPLSAFATISINVEDVQDQPPIFINSPYSATVRENTPADSSILSISAIDGDTGSNPRSILLTLENETKGYFKLKSIGNNTYGKSILYTTDKPLDREDSDILQNGGVYTFSIKATELINNELPADFSYTQITIILNDVDDNLPEFNINSFNISIPENLEFDTSLPGLSIYVNDADLGPNSQYNLTLENVQNSENVFIINPKKGEGRTPIIVKVHNPEKLDYDVDDPFLRILIFDVIASVNGKELAKSRVTVHLQDANDNSPKFSESNFHPMVKENSKINSKIIDIIATDKDSRDYGKIHYLLKGFGADYFYTDPNEGGLYVKKNLDYEKQKSFSLTIVAIDGGERESNANLLIDILDVNDNYPMFESLEYTRTIRENAIEFEPQFFVRAIDIDGLTQGGGRILYSIDSENSISGNVFAIDSETGEIKIKEPVNSMDTERGQYELTVAATDYGVPPLKNTTRVLIRVGISGNQRPVFKGHFNSYDNADVLGPPSYKVSIPENALPGRNVTTIVATDPDGIDSLLTYKLVGANDNFIIDERTGLVTVSNVSRFDRDSNPDHYAVVISVVDAGFPIPETATTTLYVSIDDVNDKPPKFKQIAYTAYISERAAINSEVVQVEAVDTDLNSKIIYSIIEPITAFSKTGSPVILIKNQSNYRSAFSINSTSGVITVKQILNHDAIAVMSLTIKAIDINAVYNKDTQYAIAEVTIYIQSFKDINPIFVQKDWTSNKPVININIKEELQIGSIVFQLIAEDPVTKERIQNYQIIKMDPYNFFSINEYNGEVKLEKRLDYEQLNSTQIEFSVKATSTGQDQRRQTITNVTVTVENVNDNSPKFDKKIYKTTVVETAKYPEKIVQVHAIDYDAVFNDLDIKNSYNIIRYSLSGSNDMSFIIDNITGVIQIAPNRIIDREKQPEIQLNVIAEDSPTKPSASRRSNVTVIIDVLDVNDNAPTFEQKFYTAVIPETSTINSFVVNITATDPDEGPGGEIRFDFLTEGDANGLLKINPITGEIRTKDKLTGKGRSRPYDLIVRAQDNGGQLPKQESLYSDISFTLYIGDVSANDGIPYFIAPKIGQIANISENATIGSPVFQVIANDPDSPSTPSGTLQYRIQEDIEDAKSFRIDSKTGLVTTLKPLDREIQSTYIIIIEVMDNGQPRQVTTRVLRINILDIDDHKPRFIREVDSRPIEMSVLEEQTIGSVVGNLTAIDEDIDENGAIDYVFIDGNQEDLFKISRNDNNAAIITTLQKLDRESAESYLLTIKCFKNKALKYSQINKHSYNLYDFSEIQIIIKILDLDDHLPEFIVKNPAIGVRLNLPIDKPIAIMNAFDIDPDSAPISYKIVNITFIPQFYKRENFTEKNELIELFTINNKTGEIRTRQLLADFVDGYFEIILRANNSYNSKRFTDNKLKVFIIRYKSLLRFVFAKPPSDVQLYIDEFAEHIQAQLKSFNLEIYILNSQVLTKSDHSLDFSSTSSCFQLSRHGSALSPSEMQEIMDSNDVKQSLLEVYATYSVSNVDSCSVRKYTQTSSLITSPGTWLVVLAVLIGISSLIATCTACSLSKRYKKQSRRPMPLRAATESYGVNGPVLYAEPIYGAL